MFDGMMEGFARGLAWLDYRVVVVSKVSWLAGDTISTNEGLWRINISSAFHLFVEYM